VISVAASRDPVSAALGSFWQRINPGSGFSCPVTRFATFITDIDPGARFMTLATLVEHKKTRS
jgi:hypothetical protein